MILAPWQRYALAGVPAYTPAQDLGANGVWYSLTESGLLVRNTQPTPDDWDMETAGVAPWSVDTSVTVAKSVDAHSGSQSLLLTHDGTANGGVIQVSKLLSGNRYALDAWAKSTVSLSVLANYSLLYSGTPGAAWANIAGEATAGGTAFRVWFNTGAGVGDTIRLDDITLTNLSVTTATPKAATGALVGANLVQATAAAMGWDSGAGLKGDGADYYVSSAAASNFKKLHDGSGVTWWAVVQPTTLVNNKYIFGTYIFAASDVGIGLNWQATGQLKLVGTNGTAFNFNASSAVGVLVNGTTTVLIGRDETGGNYEVWSAGTKVIDAASSGARSSADPTATLHLMSEGRNLAFGAIDGAMLDWGMASGKMSDASMHRLGVYLAAAHGGTWTP